MRPSHWQLNACTSLINLSTSTFYDVAGPLYFLLQCYCESFGRPLSGSVYNSKSCRMYALSRECSKSTSSPQQGSQRILKYLTAHGQTRPCETFYCFATALSMSTTDVVRKQVRNIKCLSLLASKLCWAIQKCTARWLGVPVYLVYNSSIFKLFMKLFRSLRKSKSNFMRKTFHFLFIFVT